MSRDGQKVQKTEGRNGQKRNAVKRDRWTEKSNGQMRKMDRKGRDRQKRDMHVKDKRQKREIYR